MKRLLLALSALGLMSGCMVYEVGGTWDEPCYDEEVIVEVVTVVPPPQVATWLPLPREVLELIEPRVRGYATPEPSRYDPVLALGRSRYSDDQPAWVRADFNGDGVYDHALLFSRVDYFRGWWELTTRMLVVTSTRWGYTVAVDMVLGTVTASDWTPVEEFWALGGMRPGTHTVSTWNGNREVVETITLELDGFYLTTLDASQDYVYYAHGQTIYELAWPSEGLAKRRTVATSTAAPSRSIDLTNTSRRPSPFVGAGTPGAQR